jgi:drug/metabolite transporter (DMT)-like permease
MVPAWTAALLFVDWRGFDAEAAAIFAAVGCIFPVVVSILAVRSNERLGPAVAGAVGNVTPLFAVLFAVLFALFPLMAVVMSYLFLRDERLHAVGLLGIVVSVAGVIFLLIAGT